MFRNAFTNSRDATKQFELSEARGQGDNSSDDVVLEVSALGMVHLDMLAQKEGCSPMAVCVWNMANKLALQSPPAMKTSPTLGIHLHPIRPFSVDQINRKGPESMDFTVFRSGRRRPYTPP
jgi:hypothetical protein